MVEQTNKEDEQPQAETESPSTTKIKGNWADDEDQYDGDEAEKDIGGSDPVAPKEEEAKPKIPPKKREYKKNAYGDFVITKIEIKEKEIPQTIKQDDEEEESEEESDSEPEQKEEPVEEKKSKQFTISYYFSIILQKLNP